MVLEHSKQRVDAKFSSDASDKWADVVMGGRRDVTDGFEWWIRMNLKNTDKSLEKVIRTDAKIGNKGTLTAREPIMLFH